MNKPRVGITLQALMSSTRLPQKPMRMICGREMIAHQIDRLKKAQIPLGIVLCTSSQPEDKILLEIAEREGVEAYAGPRDDVLLRLKEAAEKYEYDYIIAPAGDNPLTDPEHIDILAEYMIKNNMDYADGVNILPIGMFAKGIKATAIRKACDIKTEEDTEGWMRYFVGTKGLFKIGKHEALPWVHDNGYRLTVDTIEDFKLMEAIFEKLFIKGEVFSNYDVLQLLKSSPELVNINNKIEQLGRVHFPFGVKKEYEKNLKNDI